MFWSSSLCFCRSFGELVGRTLGLGSLTLGHLAIRTILDDIFIAGLAVFFGAEKAFNQAW